MKHPNQSFIDNFNQVNPKPHFVDTYVYSYNFKENIRKEKFKNFVNHLNESTSLQKPFVLESNKKQKSKSNELPLNVKHKKVLKENIEEKQKIEIKKPAINEIIVPITEESQTSIKIEQPLIVKDGKLTIDENVINESIKRNTDPIYHSINAMSSGLGGGGAVGILYDDGVNKEKLLKSVNNLIFKGPGVQVTRKGKDVEVYVANSINTDIDFPRESTMLSVFSMLNEIDALATQIGQITVQPNYESIGNTSWVDF